MGDRISVGLEGRGSGYKLGGVDEEKTIIMIYCLRKECIFNFKRCSFICCGFVYVMWGNAIPAMAHTWKREGNVVESVSSIWSGFQTKSSSKWIKLRLSLWLEVFYLTSHLGPKILFCFSTLLCWCFNVTLDFVPLLKKHFKNMK